MSKRLVLLSICLIISGCASKDQMLKDQAQYYNDFQTSNNAGSMFRLAESMKEAGNFDTATNLYEQTVQTDPTYLPAYIGLSQCLRYAGRPEAALETLKSAPAGEMPSDYYKEYANVMTANQDPKACISYYMKAYNIDSKDLATVNGIAVCNDLQGNHDEAQKWYQAAIQMAPAHDKLKSNYGLSLALSGKTKEAITQLKAVVNGADPTPRDRQNLAIAYGLDGQIDQAAKIFAQDLDEEDVRINLAFVYKLSKSQHYVTHAQKSNDKKDETKEDDVVAVAPIAETKMISTIEVKALPEADPKNEEVKPGDKKIANTSDQYLQNMASSEANQSSSVASEQQSKAKNPNSFHDEYAAHTAPSIGDANKDDPAETASASQGFVFESSEAPVSNN